MSTTLRSRGHVNRKGMTLVELMVVTTIILTVVAISVPVIRPMLASRKTANAAQTLEVFLNQARMRAQETGRPCGVRIDRYTDNNYVNGSTQVFPNNDVSIMVRQVEVPPPYAGNSTNSLVRVKLTGTYTGELYFSDVTEYAFWNQMVKEGDKIQFDNQGPFYTITNATMYNDTINNVQVGCGVYISGGISGGFSNPMKNIMQPVPFKVLRSPQPTLSAPVGFPTGIVIDLQYSGIKEGSPAQGPGGEDIMLAESDFQPDTVTESQSFTMMDKTPVTIMFSPAGDVMSYQHSINGQQPPNAPIHLLIGLWERSGNYWAKDSDDTWHRCETMIDAENRNAPFYLPEDNLRNYEDLSNFWVTVNSKTGMVSVNPVAPHDGTRKDPIGQSRTYANTPQLYSGGQ